MSLYFLSKIPYLKVSACFSLLILLSDILTLIVQLLTFGKSNLYLHQTSFEIYLQRYDRDTFFLRLSKKLIDLILMKQQ